MASTVKVSDWIVGVQDILQDRNPAFRRWPERDLIRYTNYGRMALATYLPQVGQRTDTIKLATGAKQDLSTVAQADCLPDPGAALRGVAFTRALRNMGADGATPGRMVRGPVDRYTKDAFEPSWMSETGTEVRELVFDKGQPTQFFVSPCPASSPAIWLQLEWMALPTDLVAGGAPGAEKYVTAGSEVSTVLGIPDQFAPDLQNYVVAAALLKGSKNYLNMPKAQMHAQLFVQSVNTQAQVATGVSPNLQALPFINEIASA